jgi:hypothetical protein
MYTDASLNRRMLHPFEKPLEEAMTNLRKYITQMHHQKLKEKQHLNYKNLIEN